MHVLNRREFVTMALAAISLSAKKPSEIMTVKGPLAAKQLGKTLVHEHFLVDFIGADKINPSRWKREAVVERVLPLLFEAKAAGIKSIFDCTPAFLGRDPLLLSMLAEQSGLNIITNTGYYGAVQNKYLPSWAFTESAEQLAARWIKEFESGMDGTAIRPGFIKIGVDAPSPLSQIHRKLVNAAALTHLKTGLTICSHTGPGAPALEELEILKEHGLHPQAFVWVHAQAEQNKALHLTAARQGAWVSLDGMGWGDHENYVDSLVRLKSNGLLHRVLISHDAGWYKPDEPDAPINGYTAITDKVLPLLAQRGFTAKEIDQLLIENPATAMRIQVRRI